MRETDLRLLNGADRKSDKKGNTIMDEYNKKVEMDINNAVLENMQDSLAAANRFRIFGLSIILVAAFVIIALQAWSMQKIEKGVSELNEKVIYLNSVTGDVANNVYDIKEQKTNSSFGTGQQNIVVR